MKLKLQPPISSMNWMLVAEGLEDPADWSVFLLNHGPGTDRHKFEEAAKQAGAERKVSLGAYRLLCKRGVCSFEYFWETHHSAAKAHAQRVAELLAAELEMVPEQRTANWRVG